MPNQNIFQQRIRPVLPRILQEERVFVYVPQATSSTAGIAYFPEEEFTIATDGKVTLKWPMRLQIENNTVNDPLKTMARTKFSSDEFVHTDEQVTITHPTTKVSYTNTTSSLKFKRVAQDLFTKPGFMFVSDNDFEKEEVDSGDVKDPGRYVRYKLKKNNPLEQASLVKLNAQDFNYTDEATIRWPYADNMNSGTNRTDGRGLVKIRTNSQDYLKYDDGYLALDKTKLLADTDVKPTYGDPNFAGHENYLTDAGFAKRDTTGHVLLKLTKDAIGLGNVENRSFANYEYDDFGQGIKDHFTNEFNKKLDKTTWNKLFDDWKEPSSATVQKVITDLRDEDEAIRDAMRTNRQFLGFFEDAEDLRNTYEPGEWTFGSTAFVRDTKTYWRVRATNVNKMIDSGVPTKADVPDDALKSHSWYRVGVRDGSKVYQWDGSKFNLVKDALKWVDAVVANAEDIDPYIKGHAKEHFFVNFKLGCRETGKVIRWTGNEWVDAGDMYYEWADAYITTLAWNTFVENDPSVIKPDGIASTGSSGKWLNSDHVHPTDQTRLAKAVFDATNITVLSEFTKNADTDFKVSFENGGDKTVNIPFVRVSQNLHNWNGQSVFTDTEESIDHYWAGTKEEYLAQKEDAANGTTFIVNDGEDFIVEDFLEKEDLDDAGITINPGYSYERFIITTTNDAPNLLGSPLTFTVETAYTGQKRYKVASALPKAAVDGQILIVDKTSANPQLGVYANKDINNQTVLGLTKDGKIVQTIESDYIKGGKTLTANRLAVAVNDRTLKPLTAIDTVDGGLIVADGTGAIKSTSFTAGGKLLQTAGEHGEKLAAEVEVSKLVKTTKDDEFNDLGIIVSDGVGGVRRQDLGTKENQLVVTDGANGLKELTLANETFVFISNEGKVISYPATTADAGKVLTAQSNGKIALQNLPAYPTYLPVTSLNKNTTTGTTLSFGETSSFKEGVLYLW